MSQGEVVGRIAGGHSSIFSHHDGAGKRLADRSRTFGDATRLEVLGSQIHHRDCRHSCPSNNPVHSIPTPGSSAHMVFDIVAVSIALVAQPLASASS